MMKAQNDQSSEKVEPRFRMNKFTELEGVYMRPEMKLRFAIKRILLTKLLISLQMKCNFVWEMVEVKRPIKNVNNP